MKNAIIYHNPRCTKSRQALQLLLDNNITPKIIEYLKTKPDEKEIKKLLKILRLNPREMMRKSEEIYKDLHLNDENLSEQDLILAMAKNPILIERPIVIINDKAIIARPPEKLLELL